MSSHPAFGKSRQFTLLAGVGGVLLASALTASAVTLPAVTVPFASDMSIDLSDVQAKLTHMISSQRKDDRCGLNYNVWDPSIRPNGRAIRVDFHARAFENKCVVTKVPKIKDGYKLTFKNEIVGETKLWSQSGHIAIDVWPVFQGQTVTFDAKVITADMGGLLGHLKLDGQIKSLLTDRVQDELRSKLNVALPAALKTVALQIGEANFIDLGNGKLGLKIKASGAFTQKASAN